MQERGINDGAAPLRRWEGVGRSRVSPAKMP